MAQLLVLRLKQGSLPKEISYRVPQALIPGTVVRCVSRAARLSCLLRAMLSGFAHCCSVLPAKIGIAAAVLNPFSDWEAEVQNEHDQHFPKAAGESFKLTEGELRYKDGTG